MGMFKNTKETKEEREKNRSNLKGAAFCLAGLLVMFLISQVFARLNERNAEKKRARTEMQQRLDDELRSEEAFRGWFAQLAPEDVELTEYIVEEMHVREDAATVVNPNVVDIVNRKADVDRAISLSKEDERTRNLELLAQEKKLSQLKIDAKGSSDNQKETQRTAEYVGALKLIQGANVSRENLEQLYKTSKNLSEKIGLLCRPGMEVSAFTAFSDSTVAKVAFVADADWNIVVTGFAPFKLPEDIPAPVSQ